MFWRWQYCRVVCSSLIMFGAVTVYAHGFVGDRFFPPTIQTDDPFATDGVALRLGVQESRWRRRSPRPARLT